MKAGGFLTVRRTNQGKNGRARTLIESPNLKGKANPGGRPGPGSFRRILTTGCGRIGRTGSRQDGGMQGP